jgi:hypothetical protein
VVMCWRRRVGRRGRLWAVDGVHARVAGRSWQTGGGLFGAATAVVRGGRRGEGVGAVGGGPGRSS